MQDEFSDFFSLGSFLLGAISAYGKHPRGDNMEPEIL